MGGDYWTGGDYQTGEDYQKMQDITNEKMVKMKNELMLSVHERSLQYL